MDIYNEIQAKKRALKRHQIKENILFTIIAIFILTITCLLLNSLNENSYKNCMEKNKKLIEIRKILDYKTSD